jgi:hypothetical protein
MSPEYAHTIVEDSWPDETSVLAIDPDFAINKLEWFFFFLEEWRESCWEFIPAPVFLAAEHNPGAAGAAHLLGQRRRLRQGLRLLLQRQPEPTALEQLATHQPAVFEQLIEPRRSW